MSRITIPENLEGKALYKFLVENKSKLIATKKASIKYSDSIVCQPSFIKLSVIKTSANKSGIQLVEECEEGTLNVKVVGNAAWWCDSQMDVLTDTCYDKSIKERGTLIPHIADHIHLSTSHVGDVKAVYTQVIPLKDLGLDMKGSTTCACMETLIREDYNEFTYRFYKNGKINQHSIGLQYMSIGICINDKDYLPEYTLWEKYYDKVINKDLVDAKGYFWIVPEIKWLENSCVLMGANELTPTLEVQVNSTSQPDDSTGKNSPLHSNKRMVICPSCEKHFTAPDNGTINCPDCGQYVSPGSTTIEVDSFNVFSAIEQTKFFN